MNSNLDKDPKSDFAINIAQQFVDLINGLYGKEQANLKHAIWEKGFKKDRMEGEIFLTPEMVEWLDSDE